MLRRTTTTAVLAGLAVLAAPLTGTALATTTFAAKSITTEPAPDGSNVVAADRPTVVATFTKRLAAGSKVTVVAKGTTANLCGTSTVSGDTVSCRPTRALQPGTTYHAVGRGVDRAGERARTATLTFTVGYPLFDPATSSPSPEASIVDGSEALTAAFDRAIAAPATGSAFRVFPSTAAGRGAAVAGSVSFGGSPLTGSDGTVTFTPATALAPGRYESVVRVVGAGTPSAHGGADYFFRVDGGAPTGLARADNFANAQTAGRFGFSGSAAPGLDVTVTVPRSGALGTDPTGSTTVPPCGAASCPWAVSVDVSGLPDTAHQSWTAVTTDRAGKSGATATGPEFAIDTKAPAAPTLTGPTIDSAGGTVTVAATDGTSDVHNYLLTVTDADGHKLLTDRDADGTDLPEQTIDVSSLDDGPLAVTVQARDWAGNLSTAQSPAPTVTKDTGLVPELAASTFTVQGSDVSMADAASQGVRSPSTVSLRFTQPVKTTWVESTGPLPVQTTTHQAALCVTDTTDTCVATGAVTATPDGHGVSIDLPDALPEGDYGLAATVFSKNLCPDGGTSCEDYSQVVTDPATGAPYRFTVDTTAPSVTIDSVTRPVTPDNVGNVRVTGTVGENVSAVQLLFRSSGGTSRRLVAATVHPTATGASFVARHVDLSLLPDGRLTVTATARDGAGNRGTDTATSRLRAHASRLVERVSASTVTYGDAVRVSGRLLDQAGEPISAATIAVTPHSLGKARAARTVTTDDAGRWSLLFAPAHTTTFHARYAGVAGPGVPHDAATASARTRVRAALRFVSPRRDGTVGRRVVVRGAVGPHKAGETVLLYRRTAHGRALLGRVTLDRRSRWAFTLRLARGRTVTLFARIGRTEGNLGNRTPTLTLRRP